MKTGQTSPARRGRAARRRGLHLSEQDFQGWVLWRTTEELAVIVRVATEELVEREQDEARRGSGRDADGARGEEK